MKVPTYKEIQGNYKRNYKRTIKTCWIADVKRSMGLTNRKAANRVGQKVKYPCPNKEIGLRIKKLIKGE